MTPIQERGIVKGRVYRITRARGSAVHASGEVVVGSLISLNEDDGTTMPFFDHIQPDGGIKYDRAVVDLNSVELELAEEVPLVVAETAKPVTFDISVDVTRSIITVDRALTTDEVKRIIDIIGG